MHLVTVSFPEATLASLVEPSAATGRDPRYRLKCGFKECWGDGAPRPWDLASHGDGTLVANGWVADPSALAPNAASRRLGAVVEAREWRAPPEGRPLLARLTAIAMRDVGQGGGAGGGRFEDAAGMRARGEAHDSEGRVARYAAWMAQGLASPRTGLVVESSPEITWAGFVEQVRKGAAGRRAVRLPAVTAVLDLSVADPTAFAAFVLGGFRKGKDLGFGCLLPYGAGLPGMPR